MVQNNVNVFNITELYYTLKMVKMVDFMLCIFYNNLKRKPVDAWVLKTMSMGFISFHNCLINFQVQHVICYSSFCNITLTKPACLRPQ